MREQKQNGKVISYGVLFLSSMQKRNKLRRRELVPMFGDSPTALDGDKEALYPHQRVLPGQPGPPPVSEGQRVRPFKTWLGDAADTYFSVEEDSEDDSDEGVENEDEDDASGDEQDRDGDEGEEELRDPEEHELCYHCGRPLDMNNPDEVATRDCGVCE